ncbi:hypothetical protein [Microbacterium sp. NPDC056234]|uniref:hypothetical protein n=1 Tax=Microbacterium sp. NPDC056234 TaxID=3345757 RepID=UPI0035E13814
MSGDMGNPEVPRDDEAREFPPPPPPAPEPSEPVLDGEVPGASVSAAVEAREPDAIDDLAVSADLAMSRVEDLDIPPAEAALPEFTIPEPPEIPPLDATAVVLLEDETASTSAFGDSPVEADSADQVPPPATRSELRARTSGGAAEPPGMPGARPAADSTPLPADPSSAAPPARSVPFGAPTAAPFDAAAGAPASDPSNPRGGDTYRSWPIVIFALLGALLIAAVIGIVVLVNNPPTFSAPQGADSTVVDLPLVLPF